MADKPNKPKKPRKTARTLNPNSLANLRPPWKSGVSPNAGGRPRQLGEVVQQLRLHASEVAETLIDILRKPTLDNSDKIRLQACELYFDRSFGRAFQAVAIADSASALPLDPVSGQPMTPLMWAAKRNEKERAAHGPAKLEPARLVDPMAMEGDGLSRLLLASKLSSNDDPSKIAAAVAQAAANGLPEATIAAIVREHLAKVKPQGAPAPSAAIKADFGLDSDGETRSACVTEAASTALEPASGPISSGGVSAVSAARRL